MTLIPEVGKLPLAACATENAEAAPTLNSRPYDYKPATCHSYLFFRLTIKDPRQ